MGVVRLNAASKALMLKWVRKARAVIVEKEGDKALEIRRNMKDLLGKVQEVDGWYYGSELRLAGIALVKQGDVLIEDRRSHEAEQAVKVRKIEDDLRKFTEEKQGVIDKKRAEFEVQMEEDMEKVVDSADKRVSELMQMRKEKEIEFAQEEKLARERDGAPSSKLMTEHRTHLKEMDEMRETERDRMIKLQEEKETRNKLKLPEQSWQRQAGAWLEKTGRKVAMKEREDAEHAAQQKRKHKR